MSTYVLPQGSTVLVTGANGYIASHVVDQLLQAGFRVRGTVRSPKPWLNEYFDQKYGKGRFETVLVSDLGHVPALEAAMQGVSGIAHLASDLTFGSDPQAVIPWVVNAIRTILLVASKQPSIKRVVLTSSSRAAYTPGKNETKGLVVDENTWNDQAIRAAWDPNTPADIKALEVYSASKAEAEKMAWEWVGENKPSFVLNTVLPDFNTGRVLLPEIFGSTMGYARALLKGDDIMLKIFPPQQYVDVQDTARLHLAALLSPDVKSERLFAFAGSRSWSELVHILRNLRPNNKLIPDALVGQGYDETEVIPASRAEALLKDLFGRPGWTSFEESIEAGIDGLE